MMIGAAGLLAGLVVGFGACKEGTTEARGERRPKAGATLLRRPSLEGWTGLAAPAALAAAKAEARSKDFPYWALARDRELFVYGSTGSKPWIWGKVRHGQRVLVKLHKRGDGCKAGNWYQTSTGAYLCNTHGYTISSDDAPLEGMTPPTVQAAMPYVYKKVKDKPALQFSRLPTAAELKQALDARQTGGSMPEVVSGTKEGAYFIAVDQEVSGAGEQFYKSIGGHFVRAANTETVKASTMHGTLLGDKAKLPLAFVFEERAPVFCLEEDKEREGRAPALERCGSAEKHSRFMVARTITVNGTRYLVSPRDYAVAREAVRLAEPIKRPADVEAGEKWVHFNLPEQTMVAYEGDTPVFATLISSGKEGHDTPTGTHRQYLKYISDRMSGDDPKDGPYDIGEVPWVMYYKNSFAVHGAYWHDGFGKVRSHGCTNLAPADARWLYFWSEPAVPQGWHGQFAAKGTTFHFTRPE